MFLFRIDVFISTPCDQNFSLDSFHLERFLLPFFMRQSWRFSASHVLELREKSSAKLSVWYFLPSASYTLRHLRSPSAEGFSSCTFFYGERVSNCLSSTSQAVPADWTHFCCVFVQCTVVLHAPIQSRVHLWAPSDEPFWFSAPSTLCAFTLAALLVLRWPVEVLLFYILAQGYVQITLPQNVVIR